MTAADIRCAVLAYHKIGEPPTGTWRTWNYVPTDVFREQLDLLAEDGWEVVGLETLVAALSDPFVLPARSAVLTFDDGYRSMLDVAAPILAEYAHPGVLFVPTDYVGKTNAFDAGNEPEEPICTWDQLRELERLGVSVQPHGASHRSFEALTPDEQLEELVVPKREMEAELGGPIHTFSFPYGARGVPDEVLDRLLQDAGYLAACRYHGGVQRFPGADPFSLRRVPVGPDTDLRRQLNKDPK